MSATRAVPAAVPSLCHNSAPFASLAEKNNVGPTAVRLSGASALTIVAPTGVPSLRQSWLPPGWKSAEGERTIERRQLIRITGEQRERAVGRTVAAPQRGAGRSRTDDEVEQAADRGQAGSLL
jgi:hypothetical protein